MRKHPAIILSTILALTLSRAFLGAQGVPAPYVTKLRIGVNGDLVVLTWEDSPDTNGSLLIYRSASPINAESVGSAAAVGTVPYGQMRFEDRPGARNEWYYAVASLDESGVPYPYFLPFKNATAVGVMPESSGADLAVADDFVDVASINASAASDAVSVKFSAPSAGHRLVVYRSPDPIESSLAVLSASIVSIVEDSATEVKDYPVPGIGYYYAIVDEKRLREGSVDIKPGANATTSPVKIEIEVGANRIGLPEASPLSRGVPLPYRVIDSAVGTGDRLVATIESPERSQTGPEVEEAIGRILRLLPDQSSRMPAIVLVEKYAEESSSSDEYALSSIVKEKLARSDWKGAVTQLERFLSIRRADAIVRRARLYLGQAYAMEGKYRDALFSFLVAQETYYAETREWIAFCLEEIRAERDS